MRDEAWILRILLSFLLTLITSAVGDHQRFPPLLPFCPPTYPTPFIRVHGFWPCHVSGSPRLYAQFPSRFQVSTK